jgi:hypothetical protein
MSKDGSPVDTSQSGGATLLSSQTSDPRPVASDTTQAGQTKVDSNAKSQLAAGHNSTGPVGQPAPATTTMTLSDATAAIVAINLVHHSMNVGSAGQAGCAVCTTSNENS